MKTCLFGKLNQIDIWEFLNDTTIRFDEAPAPFQKLIIYPLH